MGGGHNAEKTALMLCQCCSAEAIGVTAITFPATNPKNSTGSAALVKNNSISATFNILAFSLPPNQYVDRYSQQIKRRDIFILVHISESYCMFVSLLGKGDITSVYSIDKKRKNIVNSVTLICSTSEIMSGFQRLFRTN